MSRPTAADRRVAPASPTRSPDNFLIFGAPLIAEDEIDEVVATLRSGWLGTGPRTMRFERDFAAYRGMSCAVALNSCTAALHLSLLACGIGPGDEVITTPLTFCATVNAILHCGATPVLADIDPVTWNIDFRLLAGKITSRTKALLPVHFAGRSCDMDPLVDLADKLNLRIIEDCAHAIETEYHGRSAGSFGALGCFSFYATKNVVTGEGGMVVTHDSELAARVRTLSLHGMSKDAWARFSNAGFRHYQVIEAGFKYNMMDLQAALGFRQLQKVEAHWQRRAEIWARYNAELQDLPLTLPAPVEHDTRHAYHLYSILVDDTVTGISRDDFVDAMTSHGIGTGVHYLSLPEHPYYQHHLGWTPQDMPIATRVGRQIVSLPISPRLSDADVSDVIAAVRATLATA